MKEKLLALLANRKFVAIASGVIIVAAGVGIGAFAYISTRPVETKKTEVKKEKVKEDKVEVPSFVDCSIEGESVEKDLTIYIKDTSGTKISGLAFQVKLLPADRAAEISEYTQAIADVDAKIVEAVAAEEAASETSDATAETGNAGSSDASAAKDSTTNTSDASTKTGDASGTADSEEDLESQTPELNEKTKDTLTEIDQLWIDRKTAIDSYATALASVDASSYTDDDMDGMISISEIDPGDYIACFVPLEDCDYFPTNNATTLNVKEKIEYTVIKNIEEKTVAASVAGDVQSQNRATPVEAAPVNTVKYIDSRKETKAAEYGQASPQTLKASVSGTASATATDSTGAAVSISTSQYVNLYATNDAASNAATITVSLAGLDSSTLSVTSANPGVASVTPAGNGTYTIATTTSVASDTSTQLNITANLTNPVTTATEGKTAATSLATTCTVSVSGASDALKTADGKTLYTDNKGTVATYGTYNPSGTYYVVTKEEETIYYGWQEINGARYYFDENGNKVTGKQTINGATYNFGSDGVLLTSGTGIDVSKWQGNINWSEASKNISFAILRVGFRGSSGNIAVDPKFARNIQEAKNNGVRVGVYFYSIAMNEAQAVEEASLAVQQVKQYGGVSLPIYIDMEDSTQKSLSTAERDAIVMAFCRTVQNSGYSAGVYANKNWLTNYLTPSSYGGISIWCAQYNTQCTYSGRYDIWQYSSKGSVPGISGNVDMNISYF